MKNQTIKQLLEEMEEKKLNIQFLIRTISIPDFTVHEIAFLIYLSDLKQPIDDKLLYEGFLFFREVFNWNLIQFFESVMKINKKVEIYKINGRKSVIDEMDGEFGIDESDDKSEFYKLRNSNMSVDDIEDNINNILLSN